jgi:hypothetical protein
MKKTNLRISNKSAVFDEYYRTQTVPEEGRSHYYWKSIYNS